MSCTFYGSTLEAEMVVTDCCEQDRLQMMWLDHTMVTSSQGWTALAKPTGTLFTFLFLVLAWPKATPALARHFTH